MYWGFVFLCSRSCEFQPLCTLSAAHTIFFPVSWFLCDHLWYSNGAQTLWLAWTNSWSGYYEPADHKETETKFTFCSKKLSFDFSISKSGIIQIGRAEIMSPSTTPPTPPTYPPHMLLSSPRIECVRNNLHMAHFCLCGFHLAINSR